MCKDDVIVVPLLFIVHYIAYTHNHFEHGHVSSQNTSRFSRIYIYKEYRKWFPINIFLLSLFFFCFISRRSALKESPIYVRKNIREIKHKNFIPFSTIYFYIGFDWFFNVPIRWCYIEMDVIIRTDIMYDDVLFLNMNRHVSKSCSKFRFLLILCLEYD